MSTATVVAPARANAVTMSTRCPAQVNRTAVTRGSPPRSCEDSLSTCTPAASLALVGSAEEGERRAQEDPQVDARRAVLDVPDVELDPLLPRQGGAPVDLRPAGEAGLHVEPAALALRVLLHLVAQGRPGP